MCPSHAFFSTSFSGCPLHFQSWQLCLNNLATKKRHHHAFPTWYRWMWLEVIPSWVNIQKQAHTSALFCPNAGTGAVFCMCCAPRYHDLCVQDIIHTININHHLAESGTGHKDTRTHSPKCPHSTNVSETAPAATRGNLLQSFHHWRCYVCQWQK